MADLSAQPRRKRVRKGTRSCWECKRRKIRCEFADEEASCVGCLDRGSKCVSQEFVDEVPPPPGSQLGQQIGRMETLLERLIAKVDAQPMAVGAPLGASRDSLGIDVLTPSSTPSHQYEGVPVLSLFNNNVFGREPHDGSFLPHCGGPLCAATSASSPLQNSAVLPQPSKLERLRRGLAAMLPSQHDVDKLLHASNGWWLIQRHVLPHLDKFPNHEHSKPFDVQGVSQSHPIVVTRLLLSLALCIQQLQPSYDSSRLHLSGSLKHYMEQYMDVATSITSDDEVIGSMEGIECLILQGIFHVNVGNIRRAWLYFRRATSIAQLMGLQRPSLPSSVSVDTTIAWRRHYLWFQLVKADRFLSLILGVPSSGAQSFQFDDSAEWLSVEDVYNKHLVMIATLVLDRNQGDMLHAFSTTQNIDERLENLAKQMPSSWWELPTNLSAPQGEEIAQVFDRVMAQLWHFELEGLVHLPFMLRAATDRRYEYNRLSCLAASRGLITRWLFMQKSTNVALVCRIYQFQVFKAAIILLLGILQPSPGGKRVEMLHQEEEDRLLVNSVKQMFEDQQKIEADSVLSQSVEALNTLQSVYFDNNRAGSLQLTIPHFGTISIARRMNNSSREAPAPQAVSSQMEGGHRQIDPALYDSQNLANEQQSYPAPPMLNFASSVFPTLTTEAVDWQFDDPDILLFDSLINTDLVGNWEI